MATIGWVQVIRQLGWCLPGLLCAAALAGTAAAQDAATLRAGHTALREQLANNPFKRPLYIESSESSEGLKGEVHAVIEQPYGAVGPSLEGMDHWCEILILHLNVKDCQSSNATDTLTMMIGRKFDQPLADAYQLDFTYRIGTANADYLRVVLNAAAGPLGTKNYAIVLEAVPLDEKRTFVHMSYAYDFGMAARLAMQVYLATIGRNKVGFSIVGQRADGKPAYITGVRGVVERNTMRYYLAIEAYLGAIGLPAAERLDKRLNDWFAAIERYPLQLHEMERNEYIEMKHHEVRRQQAGGRIAASAPEP